MWLRLIPVLALVTGLAYGQEDLAGRWADETIALTLAGEGEYGVTVEVSGVELPGEATYDGEMLRGTFMSEGERFSFQAQLESDGRLRLETEDAVYRLRRAGAEAPAETRNPLALAARARDAREEAAPAALSAAEPGTVLGPFELRLPLGWQGQVDQQGGVQLAPPGFADDGSEAYAVAHMPGVKDPTSPAGVGAAGALLGPAAERARLTSTAMEFGDRPGVVHAFLLPQLGRRVNVYMKAVDGGVIAVVGSGLDAKVTARDRELRGVLESARIPRGGPAAPPEGPGAVTTAANAPPFRAGEVSDGDGRSLQWVAHLAGKRLSNAAADGDPRTMYRVVHYANGRFEYEGPPLGPLTAAQRNAVPTAAKRVDLAGWWRVVTVEGISYLGVVFDGRAEETYSRLDMENGATYLDGRIAYVTAP